MKSQDHKSTIEDGKVKIRPGLKNKSAVAHPTFQLQQLEDNKAVTNMIQRNDSYAMNKYQFKDIDNEIGEPMTHYAPTGEESNESSRTASDIIGSKAGGEDDIYQE